MMPKGPHRILFLYSELAGYFLACAKELGKSEWVEAVLIIHWPVNSEAPFVIGSTDEYELVDKSGLDQDELEKVVADFNPTALVCSGWMDSDYKRIARQWLPKIPVVLTFDNWWTGSLRQRLAVWTAPFYIRRHFNRVWVPGDPQLPFARKLGFPDEHTATGFYCADPVPFLKVWEARKNREPAKKLLYVGRYLPVKGVRELWAAFASLSDDYPEWELHCIGTGDLWEERTIHPKIIHHGFLQPHELTPHLIDAAAFVIPSKKEPWGVVLHEMAIAGLPLLASRAVGAATVFATGGKNAYVFDKGKLGEVLRAFMTLPAKTLEAMGRKSHEIALKHSLKQWRMSLLKLCKP
ncbi:MAG TPA: glycosyl transferase family 1 [Flavobacteriales bacterium]|nr:glycosyl transferase family 1 [Flavobacteriales bacterium]